MQSVIKCPKVRRAKNLRVKRKGAEDTSDHVQPPSDYRQDWIDPEYKPGKTTSASESIIDANTDYIPKQNPNQIKENNANPPSYASVIFEGLYCSDLDTNSDLIL